MLSNADVSGCNCCYPQLLGTKGGVQVEMPGVWEEGQFNTFPLAMITFRKVWTEGTQVWCSTVGHKGVRGRGPEWLTRQRGGNGRSPRRSLVPGEF